LNPRKSPNVCIAIAWQKQISSSKNKFTESIVDGKPQPAKVEEGKTWIAENKMREDMAESSTIVRPDLNRIYTIDHSKETYSEIDKVSPPEAKQVVDVMQVRSSSIREIAETQTIRGRLCQEFLVEVEICMMKMEIWASKQLGIDLNAYKKFSSAILSLNPFTKDLSDECNKIEGYPVIAISSMTMMGTETKEREEVVSVKKKMCRTRFLDFPRGIKKYLTILSNRSEKTKLKLNHLSSKEIRKS
jgi:hypothetical protein